METTKKNPFLTPKVKKESAVERHLVREVVKFGGVTRKASFLSHAGAPDRLVMFPGVLAWVELKSASGKLTPWQYREHACLRAMGQRVYVVRTDQEATYMVEELHAISRMAKRC